MDTENIKVETKEIKQSDIRKFNRLYITRQLKRVRECGHRFDENQEPHNNCEFCWFAFFNMHAELIKQADQCFTEMGKDILERIRGKRFTKMFTRFMSTVEQFMKEKQKEQNGPN